MSLIVEAAVAALIVIGAVFGLVGSYGLVKLPDLMTRLHAPTKATTLGVGGVLAASMVFFTAAQGALAARELLVALFLFITAPVSAAMIAKAWLHTDGAATPLPEPTDGAWADRAQP